MDFKGVIEEAYRQASYTNADSSESIRSARLSLNLLITEWQNRGTLTWNIKSQRMDMNVGVACQEFTPDITDPSNAVATNRKRPIEIIDVLYTDGTDSNPRDITLRRRSASEYSRQTEKLTQGRPSSYWVDKQADKMCINLWPVPDNSVARLTIWYLERVDITDEDTIGTSALEMIPVAFLPALISGLAYKLAFKFPTANRPPGYYEQVVMPLQAEAERLYKDAFAKSNDTSVWSLGGSSQGVKY